MPGGQRNAAEHTRMPWTHIQSHTHTHQPLLTLTDSTWLLKPSSSKLSTSVSTLTSRPSKHSRPKSEIEGTENIWKNHRKKLHTNTHTHSQTYTTAWIHHHHRHHHDHHPPHHRQHHHHHHHHFLFFCPLSSNHQLHH